MKKDRFIPATISGLLGVYCVLTIWQPGGSAVLLDVTHVAFVTSALLAAVLTLKAARTFESGMSARYVWLLLSAGLTVLTFSEALWIVYHVLRQPQPYPSLVDISWGIGFLPMLASLVLHYRTLHVQLSRRRKRLMLAAYLGVLFVVLLLSLEYILSHPGEVVVMQLLIGAYYLIGNLGVAFIAVLSLVYLGGGLVARPWVYLVSSILMFAVGGLAFSYGTWTGTYATGANLLSVVSDVAYLAGYLLAAAGGYSQLTLRLPHVTEE